MFPCPVKFKAKLLTFPTNWMGTRSWSIRIILPKLNSWSTFEFNWALPIAQAVRGCLLGTHLIYASNSSFFALVPGASSLHRFHRNHTGLGGNAQRKQTFYKPIKTKKKRKQNERNSLGSTKHVKAKTFISTTTWVSMHPHRSNNICTCACPGRSLNFRTNSELACWWSLFRVQSRRHSSPPLRWLLSTPNWSRSCACGSLCPPPTLRYNHEEFCPFCSQACTQWHLYTFDLHHEPGQKKNSSYSIHHFDHKQLTRKQRCGQLWIKYRYV